MEETDQSAGLRSPKLIDFGAMLNGLKSLTKGADQSESALASQQGAPAPAENSAVTLQAPARVQTVVSENSWQQSPDALNNQTNVPAPQLEPEPPVWLRQSATPESESTFAVPAPVDKASTVPASELVIENDSAVVAPAPEKVSLLDRARADFARRGYKHIGNDDNGTEIWYNIQGDRAEINPTVTTEHQERQHDEWFDQALEAAKTPEDAVQAMESKLTELGQRAGEKAKKVDSIEAERDKLMGEMAAIEETAREKLPRGKSPSNLNRREYLISTRNRYWEIKSRLDAINGTDDQVGGLDSAREELAFEGSAQKSRRLRRIRQIRGEMEQFQEVIDNPTLLDEYKRLSEDLVKALDENENLQMVAVDADTEGYKRDIVERLLELESQLPPELVKLVRAELHPVVQQHDAEPKDVSPEAIEKAGAFEENLAYGKAAKKLKKLIENRLEEIKLNPPAPETEIPPTPGEPEADEVKRIRELEERIEILSRENLELKGFSSASQENEAVVLGQLPIEVQQRLKEVGEITKEDRIAGRRLEAKINQMVEAGSNSGKIGGKLSEWIKGLPEVDREAARNSLQRQLMARSARIQADETLTPDEKRKRISSLRDVAVGAAEAGELVFPGLEGMLDFLMQNIVDSLNATK